MGLEKTFKEGRIREDRLAVRQRGPGEAAEPLRPVGVVCSLIMKLRPRFFGMPEKNSKKRVEFE